MNVFGPLGLGVAIDIRVSPPSAYGYPPPESAITATRARVLPICTRATMAIRRVKIDIVERSGIEGDHFSRVATVSTPQTQVHLL